MLFCQDHMPSQYGWAGGWYDAWFYTPALLTNEGRRMRRASRSLERLEW